MVALELFCIQHSSSANSPDGYTEVRKSIIRLICSSDLKYNKKVYEANYCAVSATQLKTKKYTKKQKILIEKMKGKAVPLCPLI